MDHMDFVNLQLLSDSLTLDLPHIHTALGGSKITALMFSTLYLLRASTRACKKTIPINHRYVCCGS